MPNRAFLHTPPDFPPFDAEANLRLGNFGSLLRRSETHRHWCELHCSDSESRGAHNPPPGLYPRPVPVLHLGVRASRERSPIVSSTVDA